MSFLNVDKQNSAQTPTICNLDTVIKLHIKIVRKKNIHISNIFTNTVHVLYHVYDIQFGNIIYIIHLCYGKRHY